MNFFRYILYKAFVKYVFNQRERFSKRGRFMMFSSTKKFWSIVGLSIILLSSQGWAAQTLLLTQATVNGSAVNPGDTFSVNVTVTNVGNDTAINVRGDLRNVPASWIVSPTNTGFGPTTGSYGFGNLAPGQTARVVYTVTRDATEAGPIDNNSKELWSRVFADNAPVAESRGIEVPIHPVVGGLLATAIAGSAFLISRKK